MLSTFETRFDVTPEVSELLAQNASHWSWGLDKAWSLRYRHGLSERPAYAELCKFGFTSKQVGSILIAVDMRYKAIRELKEYELENLDLAIETRTKAISTKNRKIESLTKRGSKLLTQRNKLTPKNGKERSTTYRGGLSSIRDAESDLQFCNHWGGQKSQALDAKKGKQATLAKTSESGRFSIRFGSSMLLAQRPGMHNTDSSPFESVDAWQMACNDARQSHWWSVGATDKPCGNPEVQWLAQTKQLRIRLTDKVAHARMDALGAPHSGGKNTDLPGWSASLCNA